MVLQNDAIIRVSVFLETIKTYSPDLAERR